MLQSQHSKNQGDNCSVEEVASSPKDGKRGSRSQSERPCLRKLTSSLIINPGGRIQTTDTGSYHKSKRPDAESILTIATSNP